VKDPMFEALKSIRNIAYRSELGTLTDSMLAIISIAEKAIAAAEKPCRGCQVHTALHCGIHGPETRRDA
jgi:hypothetical protein